MKLSCVLRQCQMEYAYRIQDLSSQRDSGARYILVPCSMSKHNSNPPLPVPDPWKTKTCSIEMQRGKKKTQTSPGFPKSFARSRWSRKSWTSIWHLYVTAGTPPSLLFIILYICNGIHAFPSVFQVHLYYRISVLEVVSSHPTQTPAKPWVPLTLAPVCDSQWPCGGGKDTCSCPHFIDKGTRPHGKPVAVPVRQVRSLELWGSTDPSLKSQISMQIEEPLTWIVSEPLWKYPMPLSPLTAEWGIPKQYKDTVGHPCPSYPLALFPSPHHIPLSVQNRRPCALGLNSRSTPCY